MAEFPVPFNDRRISYTAVGGETTYDFDFPVYEETDLEVVRTRTGTDLTLTLTTHYTVAINADQEADPGGTVTLVTAALAADVYVISGQAVIERTTDFQQRSGWLASEVNKQFDRIIFMLQEMLRDTSTFVVRFATSFTGTPGTIDGAVGAGQFLRRNAANDGWEVATVTDDGSVVTASTTVEGITEHATDAEAQAKSATNRSLTASNLAALGASPTFAGLTEHATDAEYIAKTATDKALVPSNLAARPCFSAHKNGTNQTGMTSAAAVTVTWSTELFDVGSYFASNAWTPPAGKAIISAGLYYTSANGVDNESLWLSLCKNGTTHKEVQDSRGSTGADGVAGTWIVDTNGTDAWTIKGIKGGAGDGTVDGGATWTYFMGAML